MARFFKGPVARRQERLSAYIDGRLSPGEREEVERQLARSDEARRELESLQATVRLVRMTPRAQVRRSFALSAAMVEARAEAPSRGLQRSAASLATAAAALFLAFSLVGGSLDLFGRDALPAGGGEDDAVIEQAAPQAAPAPQAAAAEAPKAADGGATERSLAAGAEAPVVAEPEAVTEPLALATPARRFPWLALEIAAGALLALAMTTTFWLYRRSRAPSGGGQSE